jgi:DNA-binding transcriptional MerR regulator
MFIFGVKKVNILETYSISSVEQLTGIKAHTLRIWERRYNSLNPHRTSTNIRYYDDAQLKKLLNISTLLNHGYKISALCAMSDEELNEAIASLFEQGRTVDTNDLYITALTNYMLSFDERSFDKVFSSVITKLGFYEAVVKVVYPFLRKTGVLWSTSNAAPSQEHFASHIVKRKLLAAIDGIPYPEKPKGKFLLFLPPDEWHELGLLVADFLIRSSGWETVYLGQNLPFSSLEIAIEVAKPNRIISFFTCVPNVEDVVGIISEISTRHDVKAFLCVFGKVEGKYKNTTVLDTPSDLFNFL